MVRIQINDNLDADCVKEEATRIGEVYHVQRNRSGGALLTPIARYFAWRPIMYSEGFHEHWRIDCFVRRHELAPDPQYVAKELTAAMIGNGLCEEPIWVSWHLSEEIAGEALGEVFDFDQ